MDYNEDHVSGFDLDCDPEVTHFVILTYMYSKAIAKVQFKNMIHIYAVYTSLMIIKVEKITCAAFLNRIQKSIIHYKLQNDEQTAYLFLLGRMFFDRVQVFNHQIIKINAN